LTAQSGELLVMGENIFRLTMAVRQVAQYSLGYVFQTFNLIPV